MPVYTSYPEVTGLYAGLYNTEDCGTFTGVIYSFGGSTSCSSHIIFILAPTLFHCSIVYVGTLFIAIRQTQYERYDLILL